MKFYLTTFILTNQLKRTAEENRQSLFNIYLNLLLQNKRFYVLDGVKDIAICRLTSADVVRHALVQEIINAYERAAKKQDEKKPAREFHGKYYRKGTL